MSQPFSFKVSTTKGRARSGTMTTPHGLIRTPIFMPVGTVASVKSLDQQDLLQLDSDVILANTYHLYLRPGTDTLEALGGLHAFMGWQKPILTDSGGFQVLSLGTQAQSKLATVDETGVGFTSHIDGSNHHFSPEKSIEIQQSIGADIIMTFDEAMSDSLSYRKASISLARTHRWAKQCLDAWESTDRLSQYGQYQALFGIVQGSLFEDLRKESARYMSQLPFDGIAIGGETIGYNREGTVQILNWLKDILPEDKPRYAMGLGRDPEDLLAAILNGVDMFDCVGPTRLARNGSLYTGQLVEEKGSLAFQSEYSQGRVRISSKKFYRDTRVIDADCDCHTCVSGYTRAYLHHLYKTKELAYYRLASIHNVRYMVRLSQEIRAWIEK
ncbi:MAG: tRNA guanosine(34) transglycosylase Tgt [Patescibacteria group bacterium]